jgi:GNAT superfamily N-acetyltransferase
MDVQSLGYRTDLMLLALAGSSVEQRDDHLVIRTPANPTHHWGNFLLLRGAPAPGSLREWIAAFRREFPDAEHLALGVDGTEGLAGDADELAAAGLGADRATVLTADAVRPPPHPQPAAPIRMPAGDADWRAALALREAVHGDRHGYLRFARRNLAAMRRLQDRGLGGWFGAFDGGRMVCGLGVFTDGSGIARYQSVETDPGYRRQGLAGTLVHTAARYALHRLGARRLVMVADPDYVAIRIYRSLGFSDAETQVQLQLQPDPDPDPGRSGAPDTAP